MTNKEKFLADNVGFHFEDLSLIRRIELQAIATDLKVGNDWILLALSKDSIESWEKWGFNLFKKPEFKSNIDKLLAIINKMDEKDFKKSNTKGKTAKQLSVSPQTFKQAWESVKAQGRLYTEAEAANKQLTSFWTYSNAVNPDYYDEVNTMIACEWLDEEEWVKFMLSVQHVSHITTSKQERRAAEARKPKPKTVNLAFLDEN